jgi:hypothetical protein
MAEEMSWSSDDDNHMSDDSQQAASRKRRLDIPPIQVHDEKRRKHDRPFAAAKWPCENICVQFPCGFFQ